MELKKLKTREKINEKKEPIKLKQLPSMKEKEAELDSLLSAEEQAAYDRLEKQGMSDQGIVSPKELKEFGKDVYRGVKSKVKKVAEKVSAMIGKSKENEK
jgi:TRAP-type C4-dicarboxylate transport system substrate-binding protein